jgi:hypothetical protein
MVAADVLEPQMAINKLIIKRFFTPDNYQTSV